MIKSNNDKNAKVISKSIVLGSVIIALSLIIHLGIKISTMNVINIFQVIP